MRIRFTKHAKEKFILMRQSGFPVLRKEVVQTIKTPVKIEERTDGTSIVTSIYDPTHVLRVVYRIENAIIIVITFYPGRRKAYEV